jgi:hypothetical protein
MFIANGPTEMPRIEMRLTAILFGLLLLPQAWSQTEPRLPAPVWSGQGRVPEEYANRKVFLTPDLHNVIILWPNPDGTVTKRRFPIHNDIRPDLRVRMNRSDEGFQYRYELENRKESKDSLGDFSLVIYPDPNVQLNSAEWTKGSIGSADQRPEFPGAPYGALADWTSKLNDPPLLPGASTNFSIVSLAKPGFTVAETEHFPHTEVSDGWPNRIPDEVMDELMPVVIDYSWAADYFITLGPRYGADTAAPRIASDYLVGIKKLSRIHRLESDSPFLEELIANLDAIASGSSAQIPITQKPGSELEAEILNALQLSLHFTYNGPP